MNEIRKLKKFCRTEKAEIRALDNVNLNDNRFMYVRKSINHLLAHQKGGTVNKIYIVFILCLLMLGCVTTSTLKFDPQALSGQKTISKDGVEAVISQKKLPISPATVR